MFSQARSQFLPQIQAVRAFPQVSPVFSQLRLAGLTCRHGKISPKQDRCCPSYINTMVRVSHNGSWKFGTVSKCDNLTTIHLDSCFVTLWNKWSICRRLPWLAATSEIIQKNCPNRNDFAGKHFEIYFHYKRPAGNIALVPVYHIQTRFYCDAHGIGPRGSQCRNKPNIGSFSSTLYLILTTAMLIFLFYLAYQVQQLFDSRKQRIIDIDEKLVKPMMHMKTHIFKSEKVKVTFADVKGAEDAKRQLKSVVQYLKSPKKLRYTVTRKGILLNGNSGVGKTHFAKAVAGEADVPFFYVNGEELNNGVGNLNNGVENLFDEARKVSPCVIFIDEIELVGTERSIHELKTQMERLQLEDGIVVFASTTQKRKIDRTLLKPGRFNREVVIPNPSRKARRELCKIFLGKVNYDPEINIDELGCTTSGFSVESIRNVVNQAAERAEERRVTWDDLRYQIMESRYGRIKKIHRRKEHVLRTAYHEAGHTIVCLFNKEASKLDYVTILPTEGALGMMVYQPSSTKGKYLAQIDVSLAGKAAEELIFGQAITGSSEDLNKATNNARNMMKHNGMSEEVSCRTVAISEESEEDKQLIESEVDRILTESRERVRILLKAKRVELERIAQALMEYGTLERHEVLKVIKGEQLDKKINEELKAIRGEVKKNEVFIKITA